MSAGLGATPNSSRRIADPKHESHAEMVQWAGKLFDPTTIGLDDHAKAVADFAKAWSRKPAGKRKTET
jgi:hypothetical protein